MGDIMLESFDETFDLYWDLLCNNFSKSQLRTYHRQKIICNMSNYKISFIKQNSDIVAFASWWDFDWCIFLEYISVIEKYRNKGIGSTVLKEILCCNELLILECLEDDIELLTFYKKRGFVVNNVDYTPIKLNIDNDTDKYLILSYKRKLSDYEYNKFLNEIHNPKYN